MSDRLAELQRQRALAQEQVAWFDREIAKETGQAPTTAAAPVTVVPTTVRLPAPTDFTAKDNAAAREAEDIIAQYQQSPADAAKDAKKGCYMWFVFVMMTVVLCAAGIYFLYR